MGNFAGLGNVIPTVGTMVDRMQDQALMFRVGGKIGFGEEGPDEGEITKLDRSRFLDLPGQEEVDRPPRQPHQPVEGTAGARSPGAEDSRLRPEL